MKSTDGLWVLATTILTLAVACAGGDGPGATFVPTTSLLASPPSTPTVVEVTPPTTVPPPTMTPSVEISPPTAVTPPTVTPSIEIDLSANYTVTGTNPDGSSYKGDVSITKNGPWYDIVWTIGGDTWTGSGVLNGHTFSVRWIGPGGQGKGTATYTLQPDGTLSGTWNYDGQQEQGTETLTPAINSL